MVVGEQVMLNWRTNINLIWDVRVWIYAYTTWPYVDKVLVSLVRLRLGLRARTHKLSEAENNSLESWSEEEHPRRSRKEWRPPNNSSDFRVEILVIWSKADPDEFLGWLNTVERIFEYKEILKDKKVKLVALRLRKYASLWWLKHALNELRIERTKLDLWRKRGLSLNHRFCLPLIFKATIPNSIIWIKEIWVSTNIQGSLNNPNQSAI